MATGDRDERATQPATRGLLGALAWPRHVVGLVLAGPDDGAGPCTRLGRYRRAGLVVALVLAVGDAVVVAGLMAFDFTRAAFGVGRWLAKVVPA